MSSMLRCLLRVCFEETPEDESGEYSLAPRSNSIVRILQPVEPASVATAAASSNSDDEDENDNCCRPCTNEASSSTAEIISSTPAAATAVRASTTTIRRMSNNRSNTDPASSLSKFWRTFREKLNLDTPESNSSNDSTNPETRQQKRDETVPILTQASSFDSSREIPTIQNEQVVMPGSELQFQMAKAMSEKLEAHDDENECVICMEGFDPTNPRMPTLCGCGSNKTYFHLPCLYQWIEQSKKCPSCAKRLRWEEF